MGRGGENPWVVCRDISAGGLYWPRGIATSGMAVSIYFRPGGWSLCGTPGEGFGGENSSEASGIGRGSG